ncbi:hypothetical protein FRB96_006149 [Tulasnella sp. 330]|nr:hypothetical protein FRB96_006149 [Tulasnella sp. 330]
MIATINQDTPQARQYGQVGQSTPSSDISPPPAYSLHAETPAAPEPLVTPTTPEKKEGFWGKVKDILTDEADPKSAVVWL